MSNINWENGVYRAPGTEEKQRTFRVMVASDWGALWDYTGLMQRDPLAVYGDLLPLFRASDLNLVNVECALDEGGAPIKKGGPNLRGVAGTVRSLSAVPFQVACLANNHIMDFGPESLQATIAILREAGLSTVGAGMNGTEAAQPLEKPMPGATLAILNCAEGEACASLNGGPGANPFDVPALQRRIREMKQRGNAVLLVFHGGREYAPLPPPYVVDGLRQLAEAGADAIIGHHPHVPQGIEIHHGTPIAYSQGNFVFRRADTNQDYRYFHNTGYLAHLDFARGELVAFSLTPYRMQREGVFALQGAEKTQLLQELQHVSALLRDEDSRRQVWNAFVDDYGGERLFSALAALARQSSEDSELAAARLHNFFFCPAHRELYLNGLKRLSRGELGDSPQWARELVNDWNHRPL